MAYESQTIELTFEQQAVVMAGLQLLQQQVDNGGIANEFFGAERSINLLIKEVRAKIVPVASALGLI